jgi:hypothetical protein
MKMMALGVAALTALMAGASPAAAQQADADAVCFIAVTTTVAQAQGNLDKMPEDVRPTIKYFEGALHFYAGKLTARYSAAELGPVMKLADAEYRALERKDRSRRSADCVTGEKEPLMALANAVKD